MTKLVSAVLATLAATIPLVAAADTFALVNGRIYTENSRQPWAESLIVADERIVYVGKSGTT